MGIFVWFDQHAGSFGALGAIAAAAAATVLLIYMRRQTQEMLETRRDQYRPLLIPVNGPPTGTPADGGKEWFDPDAPNSMVKFKNIGPGPAHNVWAVIFGPPPAPSEGILARRRTVILSLPIAAGQEGEDIGRAGVTVMGGDMSIVSDPQITLCAPAEPTMVQVIQQDASSVLARYTITCCDIFGRTHASVFDFTAQHRWRTIGFFAGISKDLEQVHRESFTARMTAVTRLAQVPASPDL
jgi:hypothetical protein